MKKLKLLILILLILPLTGCYNYRELNKLGITSAIGISKTGDNYNLIIEVLDTQKNGDDTTPQYVLYETTGKTIQEALRKIVLKSSKRLYINHMDILLIDENIAREGISEIMDYFFRDPESRKQFLVLLTKNSIKDILNTNTALDSINAKSIKERMDANKRYFGTIDVNTFSKLMINYTNPYKEIDIPTIELDNNELVMNGTGLFKDDKLVGYITKEETLYLNIINNNIDDTILTNNDDESYSSIEVNDCKTNIKVNNKNIDINIKILANISEIHNKVNLTDIDTINNLQTSYENYVNNNIKTTISKIINQYDTDVFGFTDLIYKNDNKNFDKNIKLKDLNISVNTNITLQFKGNGAYNIYET